MFDRLLRNLFFAAAAVAVLAAQGAGTPALADEPTPMMAPAPVSTTSESRSIKLGLNKSVVIDLPRDARDILVSNPDIADAVIRTSRRIYLTGVKLGQTNIVVFDRNGHKIIDLDVAVQEDTANLTSLINRLVPGAQVYAEFVNGSIVLSGTVKNAADARRAEDIANAFLGSESSAQGNANMSSSGQSQSNGNGGGSITINTSASTSTNTKTSARNKIINMLTIEGQDQVHLKVTVAEVQRNAVKQLGVDWALDNVQLGGAGVLSGNAINPFGVGDSPDTALSASRIKNITVPVDGGSAGASVNAQDKIQATVRALEKTGLMRTLAEPTLTSISGESASFLAGGEFPIITGYDPTTGLPSTTFKPYGVKLTFTPVVLSAGRISLHVKTEVSELSNEGAIALNNVSIPSLKVRRAETTLELPSGGSMVLAGLMQDNVKQSLAGLPGLKKLPVLGALFRSRDYLRNETELIIMITPYLVKPVARSALARPDDGFAPASDATANFLGRLNRVYGVQGQPPPSGTYQGRYGFICE